MRNLKEKFVLNKREVEILYNLVGAMSRREILLYLNENQFNGLHVIYTDAEEYLLDK